MKKLTISEICIFAMLGTLMFCSKMVTESLPNIHLLGVLTVAYTVTYRVKALIPIYIFVFLTGIYAGFSVWWWPYFYLWAVLWGMTMLLPKKMPKKVAVPVYMLVCGLHGLIYGTLYAPYQAIMFGLNFKEMLAWIGAGLPFDAVHAVGNTVAGILVVPISSLLIKLNKHIIR